MSQYTHNFRSPDSHLDPPDIPDEPDVEEVRVTCSSCRHTVEPTARKMGDENGFFWILECPDCYWDITGEVEL